MQVPSRRFSCLYVHDSVTPHFFSFLRYIPRLQEGEFKHAIVEFKHTIVPTTGITKYLKNRDASKDARHHANRGRNRFSR